MKGKTEDWQKIYYGDFIRLRSRLEKYIYVQNIFNDNDNSLNLNFVGAPEKNINTNIHSQIFQILPHKGDMNKMLHELEDPKKNDKEETPLLFDKTKLDERVFQIARRKIPVKAGERVRLFHPFSGAFVVALNESVKVPGKNNDEAASIVLRWVLLQEDSSKEKAEYYIRKENVAEDETNVMHLAEVYFSIDINSRIEVKQNMSRSPGFNPLVLVNTDGNKLENKHHLFKIVKFFAFWDLYKEIGNKKAIPVNQMTFFRLVTNFKNESYILAVNKENKPVLIPKRYQGVNFLNSVFQIKEFFKDERLREGSEYSVYHLPLEVSDLDQMYTPREECQYQFNLPFLRFWEKWTLLNENETKRYTFGDEIENCLPGWHILVNNIIDDISEESDTERLLSGLTTFYVGKHTPDQMKFSQVVYMSPESLQPSESISKSVNNQTMGSKIGSETVEELDAINMDQNSQDDSQFCEEEKGEPPEESHYNDNLGSNSDENTERKTEKSELESMKKSSWNVTRKMCQYTSRNEPTVKKDKEFKNKVDNDNHMWDFPIKKMEKTWEEVPVSYADKSEHTLEFKVELVNPNETLDCERLYHLALRIALFESKILKNKNTSEPKNYSGSCLYKIDKTVETLRNLYKKSNEMRRLNLLNLMLQSGLVDYLLKILVPGVDRIDIDSKKKEILSYLEAEGLLGHPKSKLLNNTDPGRLSIFRDKKATEDNSVSMNNKPPFMTSKTLSKNKVTPEETDMFGSNSVRGDENEKLLKEDLEQDPFANIGKMNSEESPKKKKSSKAEYKDEIVLFIREFLTKPPMGSIAPQIWATENINKFLEKAQQEEIQNLFKEIIKNNTYFVSLLGVDEISRYWKTFGLSSQSQEKKIEAEFLKLKTLGTVLDTIYKNISTQNLGLGLNTYLKYRMKQSSVEPAIIRIRRGNEKSLILESLEIKEEISLSKEYGTTERKMEKDYALILMDLTFHILRNYNVFYKFRKPEDEASFDYCVQIIADSNTNNKGLKSNLLEYLSARFFTHVFRLPEKVVLPKEVVAQQNPDERVNSSAEEKLAAWKMKAQNLLLIYTSYCEESLSGKEANQEKNVEKAVQAINIIKILVQKNMIFTGSEDSNEILNKFILPLALNFKRAIDLIKEHSERDDLIIKLENTLHRLCSRYSNAAAKEIAREIKQLPSLDTDKMNQILRRVKQKELVESNVGLTKNSQQLHQLCKVFQTIIKEGTQNLKSARTLEQLATYTINPIGLIEDIGTLNFFDIEESHLLKMHHDAMSIFDKKFKILNCPLRGDMSNIISPVTNEIEHFYLTYLLGKSEDNVDALDYFIPKERFHKSLVDISDGLQNDEVHELRTWFTKFLKRSVNIENTRGQILMADLELYKPFVELFLFIMDRMLRESLKELVPLALELLKIILFFINKSSRNAQLIADLIIFDELFLSFKDVKIRKLHHVRLIYYVFISKIYQNLGNKSKNKDFHSVLVSIVGQILLSDLEPQTEERMNFTNQENLEQYFCESCWEMSLFVLENVEILADGALETYLINSAGVVGNERLYEIIFKFIKRNRNHLDLALKNYEFYLSERSIKIYCEFFESANTLLNYKTQSTDSKFRSELFNIIKKELLLSCDYLELLERHEKCSQLYYLRLKFEWECVGAQEFSEQEGIAEEVAALFHHAARLIYRAIIKPKTDYLWINFVDLLQRARPKDKEELDTFLQNEKEILEKWESEFNINGLESPSINPEETLKIIDLFIDLLSIDHALQSEHLLVYFRLIYILLAVIIDSRPMTAKNDINHNIPQNKINTRNSKNAVSTRINETEGVLIHEVPELDSPYEHSIPYLFSNESAYDKVEKIQRIFRNYENHLIVDDFFVNPEHNSKALALNNSIGQVKFITTVFLKKYDSYAKKSLNQNQQNLKSSSFNLSIISRNLLDLHVKNMDIRYERYHNLAALLTEEDALGLILDKLISLLETTKLNSFAERETKEIICVWDVLYSYFKESLNKISSKFSTFKRVISNVPEVLGERKLERELIYDFQFQLIERRVISVIFLYLNSQEPELLQSVIAVANLIMNPKNTKIQREFYNEFVRDDYNTIIANIQRVLRSTLNTITDASIFVRNSKDWKLSENIYEKTSEMFTHDYFRMIEFKKNSELFQSILYFVKNLCEGHFMEMQKFLFKQTKPGDDGEMEEFSKPILLVEWMADYLLDRYWYFCHPYNFPMGNVLLFTFIEIVQGNLLQEITSLCTSTKLLDLLCKIYEKVEGGGLKKKNIQGQNPGRQLTQRPTIKPQNDINSEKNIEYERLSKMNAAEYESTVYYQRNGLITKIFQFLFSLIEQSDDNNRHHLAEYFNWKKVLRLESASIFEFFKTKLGSEQNVAPLDYFKLMDSQLKKWMTDQMFDRFLLRTLTLLINIKHMEEYGRIKKLKHTIFEDLKKEEFQLRLLERINKRYIKSIEVIDDKDKLKRILFPKYIICHFLNEFEKDKLLYYLDRSSYESKIGDYIGTKKILTAKMRDEYNKWQAGGWAVFIQYSNKILLFLFFSCTIVLNCLLFSETYILEEAAQHQYLVFIIIAIFNLIISILILLLWIMQPENHFGYLSRWEMYSQRKQKKYGKIQTEDFVTWINDPSFLEHEDLVKILHTCGPYNEVLHLDTGRPFDLRLKLLTFALKTYMALVSQKTFLYLFLVVFSILVIYHPVFSPFLLFVFSTQLKIVQDVFTSFYKNWREFLITFVFGITIMLSFSFIGYFTLRDTFITDQGNNICLSLWHCFLSTVQHGFRAGGGIGDSLTPGFSASKDFPYAARWFFDLAFWILIIVIMLNLIFGIIIDTFKSIRDIEASNELDQRSKCFVCSFEKGTIDQKSRMGFDYHVKKHHNMWNYMYYLIYLEKKGWDDHSNLETYIWDCYIHRRFQWLPYMRSLDLEENKEEVVQQDVDHVQLIEQNQFQMFQLLDKISRSNNQFKKLSQTDIQVQATLQSLKMIEGRIVRCSRDQYGDFKQPAFLCEDCKNLKICKNCTETCHKNHKISLHGSEKFACTCQIVEEFKKYCKCKIYFK